MPTLTEITGTCQYKDCDKPATIIATGQRSYNKDEPLKKGQYGIGCYCADHASEVADYNCPEYHANCPNCGCLFGVN